MVKVSLIVPVYTVEKVLPMCLNSIQKQSYKDFEAILIDDGSPDSSGQICDSYAENDSRFHVIHQENKGVSAARNAGLEAAKGQFVMFCDSDDELEPDYIAGMMNDIDDDCDLIISGVKNFIFGGGMHHQLKYDNMYISNVQEKDVMNMCDNKSINFIYAKRFRMSKIRENEIAFDCRFSLGEDTLFLVNYLLQCQIIKYVDNVNYRYYKYSSTTLTKFDKTFLLRRNEVDNEVIRILVQKFPMIAQSGAWKRRVWNLFYWCIFQELRSNDNFINKYQMLQLTFSLPEYKYFQHKLDIYMSEESKIVKKIISLGNPVILILFWNLLQLKNRKKIFNTKINY